MKTKEIYTVESPRQIRHAEGKTKTNKLREEMQTTQHQFWFRMMPSHFAGGLSGEANATQVLQYMFPSCRNGISCPGPQNQVEASDSVAQGEHGQNWGRGAVS